MSKVLVDTCSGERNWFWSWINPAPLEANDEGRPGDFNCDSAELGYLAIAWNQLHCHLMAPFCDVIDENKLLPAARKLSAT